MVFRLAPVIIASLVVSAVAAPGAWAHDVSTGAGHAAEDAVVHTAAQERALGAHTRAVSAADAQVAAAAVAGSAHDVGEWGPVVPWPVVAINAALLANGKVLAYDSIGDNATESYPDSQQNHTRATVWDPATGSQTPLDESGFNIFCSGLAHLFDGRLFLAGGNKNQALDGIRQTHIFDPATNLWSLGPQMAAGRWYPTVTPLRDGEMLITSGYDVAPNFNDTPEIYTPGGTSLRELTGAADVSLPLYPWIDVAPNGRPFYLGPDQWMEELDTAGAGSWTYVADRDTLNRDYGSHALFDIGKELVAGGGLSTRSAKVINLNGAATTVTATVPMAYGRRQHNLTVLADGTVLATGGNSSGVDLIDMSHGVYPAEQWNPATGLWRTLAAMQVTRQYHSTALLLPDGRVLSAGGGICGECDQVGYLAKNAEIFSPPYLFQADGTPAPRPAIDSAPASTDYGSQFDIGTTNPQSIQKVALVRLGAVTHSNNMDQRYVPLSFTAGATSVTATAPSNANIAPPGIYMLFIIDSNGVPSVARMVGVGNASVDATGPSVSSVTPTAGATGVDGGAAVSATFSEVVDAATVTNSTFTLRDPNGNAVAASVTSRSSTATLRPSAPLATGTTYTATLKGGSAGIKDLAGNSLATDYVWSFTTAGTPDTTPPSASLTFPTAGGAFNAAAWTAGCSTAGFCGTASDGESGLSVVEVSIRRASTSKYWNGSTFGSTTERWLAASGTNSWSYPFSLPAQGSYTVRARAKDAAGNVSTPTSTTFLYDTAAPTLAVTFPVAAGAYTTAGWNAGCVLSGMCGTASDAVSGVKKVEISIRRGTGKYWNGTSFGSTSEVFFLAVGTTSWSYGFAAASFGGIQGSYTMRVRVTDNAKNVRGPTATKFTFTP